jgi:hypothetical protein
MAKIRIPLRTKPGTTPSTQPGKPDKSPETKPGKPSRSPGEPPKPRPPMRQRPTEEKTGIKWLDELIEGLLDAQFGVEEIEEMVEKIPLEELKRMAEGMRKKTKEDAPAQRPGVLKWETAWQIVRDAIVPTGLIGVLEGIDNAMEKQRLSQLAARQSVNGVSRRIGGAGWQGPRPRVPPSPQRSAAEQRLYRAMHRTRTGYPRGRPKKGEERSYLPPRPRGRPRKGSV